MLADRTGWEVDRLIEAIAPYWDEYDSIGVDADARSMRWFELVDEPGRWRVTQILSDPAGDGEWRLVATVDLARAMEDGAPTLVLQSLAPATAVSDSPSE